MADVEIMSRVERRRKWTPAEKTALLAEVEAEGGQVSVVARRHRISASLLYNWRSAWKAAAAAAMQAPGSAHFIPLGVYEPVPPAQAMLAPPPPSERPRLNRPGGARAGGIEIALPNGARVSVDATVNERALSRVLRAMKSAT